MGTIGTIALVTILVAMGGGLALFSSYWAGRKKALEEVAKQDAAAQKAAGEVMAEHRTRGDTSDRLHNGTF